MDQATPMRLKQQVYPKPFGILKPAVDQRDRTHDTDGRDLGDRADLRATRLDSELQQWAHIPSAMREQINHAFETTLLHVGERRAVFIESRQRRIETDAVISRSSDHVEGFLVRTLDTTGMARPRRPPGVE